jgi:hypothetical protein
MIHTSDYVGFDGPGQGGALVQACGRGWTQLIFQDLFKKEQQSMYDLSSEDPAGSGNPSRRCRLEADCL